MLSLPSAAGLSIQRAANGGHTQDTWYLVVSTCLTTLLLPFLMTFLLYVAVELFVLVEKYDDMNIIEASITDRPPPPTEEEMLLSSEAIEGLDTPVPHCEERPTVRLKASKYIEANMYDYKQIRRVDPNLFQSMNLPTAVMTFFACACYSLCALARKHACIN